jgi:FKBP-type peptidyl-prolyl cis-trans isomerase (trigger factor)
MLDWTWLANNIGWKNTQKNYWNHQTSQSNFDSIDDFNQYFEDQLESKKKSVETVEAKQSTKNNLMEILHTSYPHSTLTKDFWRM